MGRVIRIDVLGTPAPKGSARAFYNKRIGRAVLAQGSSKTGEKKIKAWSAAVADAVLHTLGDDYEPFVNTPLAVAIVFRLQRPKKHYRTGKHGGILRGDAPTMPALVPDVDKIARCTLDPLTGTVFDDDSRIVELMVRKTYAKPGDEGATILVREWSPTA